MKPLNRALAIGLCIAAAAASTSPANAQVTLRLSTYINESDIRYKEMFQKFAGLVEQKTNGRVKVNIFGSSTLHPFDKGMDAVIAGVADITAIGAAAVDKRRLPCTDVTHWLPASIDWERHVELDWEYAELLKDELAKHGLVTVLTSNFSYDQEWWFRTPIDKLDNLKGRLVRSSGPVTTHIIKKWGGSPVFVAPTEVFQSAERGVVNGINMGVATFSSWKLWNVMPYMVNANIFYAHIMYTMNKKKFDALSPQDQAAMKQAGLEAAKWVKPFYETWIHEQIGNAVMKSGGSVRTLSKDERQRLIKSASEGWNNQIETACGPELAPKLRAMFKKYEK
jgi:TRAP-type C4-dicarboxylate transport system substrate-binding protein